MTKDQIITERQDNSRAFKLSEFCPSKYNCTCKSQKYLNYRYVLPKGQQCQACSDLDL